MLRAARALTIVGTLALLAACAGSSLKRLEDPSALPSDLAQDLGQFEVKEQALPVPAPVPSETPKAMSVPVQHPSKKSKLKAKQGFQDPVRRPVVDPIRLGERAVYDITYLGMTAGEFDITVQPYKQINDRKVYHVLGRARSSSVFSMFYKLDDTIQSYIDYEGIFPHRFQILLDESKQKRNSLELFDSQKGRTFFWNRWDHHKRGYTEVKDFFPMQPFSQDSLSSLFYLRTVPLPDGAVVTFPVVSEGKNWDAVVTVLRREMINTPMGRVRAIVLKPETKYQGILKKQGDSFIWLTDDDRRFMVRLEAKVKIGSIVAKLKAVEPGVVETAATTQTPPSSLSAEDEAVPPTPTRR